MFGTRALLVALIFSLAGLTAKSQVADEKQIALPALVSKGTLNPRLPSGFKRLKFSPDGNYILAQDTSNIYVLSRKPLKVHFQIDAADAAPAQFTPDSSEVVFETGGVRVAVERWSVATRKRDFTHNVVLNGTCAESLVSPDAKSLICFSVRKDSITQIKDPLTSQPLLDMDFSLIDIATGDVVLAKKGFVPARFTNDLILSALQKLGDAGFGAKDTLIAANFSPDGRYFAAGFDTYSIAVDMTSRQLVPLHGDLEKLLGGGFVFVSVSQVLVRNDHAPEKSEILDFPSGAVAGAIQLGDQNLESVTQGPFVLLRPLKTAPIGVYDWHAHALIATMAAPVALDIYDHEILTETGNGQIAVMRLPDNKVEDQIDLPLGALESVNASTVSRDFRWLALSTNSRGAVWDLSSMKRLYLLRPFKGAYFDGDKAFYGDIPALGDTPRSVMRASLSTAQASPAYPIDEKLIRTQQYGRYIVSATRSGKTPDVSILVQDATDGHTLWIKDFSRFSPMNIEVSPDENRMIFSWFSEAKPAKDAIEGDAHLKALYRQSTTSMPASLAQIFEADSGKPVGQVLIVGNPRTAPVRNGFSSGDWLFPNVDGQTRVYSISSGELKATVPGAAVTASSKAGLLVTEPSKDELQIYALPEAGKRDLLQFPSSVEVVRFDEAGRRMFVLTADQNFYIFDATTLAQPDASPRPTR